MGPKTFTLKHTHPEIKEPLGTIFTFVVSNIVYKTHYGMYFVALKCTPEFELKYNDQMVDYSVTISE